MRTTEDERDDGPDDGLAGFERALREQAGRAPRRSGADAAAAVRARLSGAGKARRGLRPAWGWSLATTGALAALLLVAGVTGRFGSEDSDATTAPPAGPAVAALGPSSPTLGNGEVLIWLDERTPLYMTFAPPSPGDRGAGSGGGS
jgi:hypothetical protein